MLSPTVSDRQVPDPSGAGRLRELDALRGLAALSVVFLHFHDMWVISDAQLAGYRRNVLEGLRFLYSGSEAVILFFVLSGLVLALPYIKGRNQNYPTFFVRRVLRIWGPYVVALALAAGADAVWHGHAYHGLWASKVWSEPVNLQRLAAQIPLVGPTDDQYLFVSWTLTQEMRISLIFPVLVAFCLRLNAAGKVLAACGLTLLAVLLNHGGREGDAVYGLVATIHYGAFFILGMLVATHLDEVRAAWQRLGSWARAAVAGCTFFLYTFDEKLATHLLRHVYGLRGDGFASLALAQWFAGLGACGWIALGLNWDRLRRVLLSRASQFLGKISFSLYLLHPIVLLALTFSAGGRLSWRLQFPIYVGGAIVCGWMFYKWVEEPFIGLSRSVRLRN